MRILVDRGQLEIFGNDGPFSVSDNVDFDSSPQSQGVEVYADGGTVRLIVVDAAPPRQHVATVAALADCVPCERSTSSGSAPAIPTI